MSTYLLAKVAHGGVTGYSRTATTTGLSRSAAMRDSEVVIDLTTIPWDDLCELAYQGPMIDAALPAGTISRYGRSIEGGGISAAFDPTPVQGRNPRLGEARPFDTVAVDVYLTIARSFGATIVKGSWPQEHAA